MHILKSFFFIAIITLFTACNSGGKDSKDPVLKDAFSLYQKAEQVEKDLNKGFEQLLQRKNDIQKQGQALTEKEIEFTTNVNDFENKIKEWKSNRVEVLGFGEHHDCSGHDHHHHAAAHLTPQQMLDIQKESLDKVKNMNKELAVLLGTLGLKHEIIEHTILNR